jgi:hypothetical protein
LRKKRHLLYTWGARRAYRLREGRRINTAVAAGTILFVPLIQPQLRADIITEIGGDTRNFTIVHHPKDPESANQLGLAYL